MEVTLLLYNLFMGWDGMGYAVGTGVATALKVVQRHSPFLVKPEGKKVRIRAVNLVV